MDFKAILTHRLSMEEVHIIRDELIHNKDEFSDFFQLIFQKPDKIAWQAAWICEKVSKADANLFTDDDYRQLIDFTLINTHSGIQRLCLSILRNLPVRKPVSVEFINNCFEGMISPKQPVGVQVLCMRNLQEIGRVEPDIAYELFNCLENIDLITYSAGFIAAKRNVIKSLKIIR